MCSPLPRQVSGALTNEFLGDTRELVSHIQWAGEEASTTYSNLSLVDAIATDLQGSSGKDILRKVNELSEAVATVVEVSICFSKFLRLIPVALLVSCVTRLS